MDGWNQLTEGSFALVVSDLEMPNLDGLEFLEKIRTTESTHQDLPFVLFTSRDDTESFERAYLLGADRCIGKSAFIEDEFVRTVRELL